MGIPLMIAGAFIAGSIAVAGCSDNTDDDTDATGQASATPVAAQNTGASPTASSTAASSPSASAASPTASPTAAAASKVSANNATRAQVQAALEAAGVPNPGQWAREVEEYRPYPANDPDMAKLRQNLAKYNPGPGVVDKIISALSLP